MTSRNKNVENDGSWERFTEAMRKIVTVPYREIKAKLEEENRVRRRKRTRKSKIAAFREANDHSGQKS